MILVFLSLSLLVGALANFKAAFDFLSQPALAASKLGLPIESFEEPIITSSAKILTRLVGACLAALAIFYFVTALGPLEQPIKVVVASTARLMGVVFYIATLRVNKGPASFKLYLVLNFALACSHLGGLCLASGGIAALQDQLQSLTWIRFVVGSFS